MQLPGHRWSFHRHAQPYRLFPKRKTHLLQRYRDTGIKQCLGSLLLYASYHTLIHTYAVVSLIS